MGHYDVRRAWEAFQDGGTASTHVRPAVLASWHRSRQHSIPFTRPAASLVTGAEFYLRRQQNAAFLHATRPAMANAREFLVGTHSMAIVTDAAGLILDSEGDARAMDLGSGVKLQRGAGWSEAEIGTNAIGTAIAGKAPVQIHAAEHFCQEVQSWTCAAAPVRDPFGEEILGVVDISGPAASFSPQSLAYAVAMARQIEALVARGIEADRDRVLRHCLDKKSLWVGGEVLALGSDGAVIYSSEKALREIARSSQDLLVGGRLALLRRLDPALWSARLATLLPGSTLEIVSEGGRDLGCVLVLPGARRPRPPKARSAEEEAPFAAILGESEVMRETREKAQRMAESGAPILLEGETGVGKELFARAIHQARTPAGPFIPVNCGGLPRDLVASELFGYEKGAFTGASPAGRAGKVEAASGGVLCLDEIGEMPLELQSYLLRVLEDGVVYRVGSHEGRRVDFRLVSMTNRNLAMDVAAGQFRKDLYYRIAMLRLRVPPLRERREDIPRLLEHFAAAAAQRAQHEVPRFAAAALDALQAHDWPGNIRELRNLVETLVVMSPGASIGLDELPGEFRQAGRVPPAAGAGLTDLRSIEQTAIAEAVQLCGGNRTKAARRLGIARSTLYARAAAFGLLGRATAAASLPGPAGDGPGQGTAR